MAWRRARGLTQAQIAQRAAVPQPNLSALEAGRLDPTLSTLRRLAAALDIPAGTLLEKTPPRPAWSRHRIDNLVRQALTPAARPVGPLASTIRGLRHVLHERLAAAGHPARAPAGTGRRAIRQLQADLGPALWQAVLRRLEKFR